MSSTNTNPSSQRDSASDDSSFELNNYTNATNNEMQNTNESISRSNSWYWFLNRRADDEGNPYFMYI